jgi:copper chaperone CopZ
MRSRGNHAAEATQSRFRVTGMDCATCASNVDTAIRRVPGVVDVSVSAGTLRLVLGSEVTGDAVVRQVKTSATAWIPRLRAATARLREQPSSP